MKLTTRTNLLLLILAAADFVGADVVLNKKIIDLALTGAELSSLAYEEDPPSDGFAHFGFYDEEPDQAIVAQRDGYCFVAFRGTTLTWVDWQQNFELGMSEVCGEHGGGKKHCCNTRVGFFKAYETSYARELETALRKCVATCENRDECVVLTGHSQGGAIAAVAGAKLADLNPYVITFGQPATLESPCPLISSERWYRFVNTKESQEVGVVYDPVPFVPGMGTEFFGHMIMLGQDPSGVAYIGLDANIGFSPLNTLGFEAHSMRAAEGVPYPGYWDRLKTLVANLTEFPIRADGFADGSLCTQASECLSGVCASETTFAFTRCVGKECVEDDDCPTGRCDSGTCVPKKGSCTSCDEDSDCAGGACILFMCSGSDGLMDDNCICKLDGECSSGRCELIETGTCEAQLPLGATCNEDSDCLSGYCTWRFQCDEKLPAGSRCYHSSDCESGSCSWRFTCKAASGSTTTSAVSRTKAMVVAPNAEGGLRAHPTMHYTQIFILVGLCFVALNYAGKAYNRYRRGYREVSSAVAELSV